MLRSLKPWPFPRPVRSAPRTPSAAARALAALLLLPGLASGQGCGVQQLDGSGHSYHRNQCDSSSECGSQGQCLSGMCLSTEGQIRSMLLEVIPLASAFYGAGDSFLIPVELGPQGAWNQELRLPTYAQVHGKVSVAPVLLDPMPSACASVYDPVSGSMGVHVELTRTRRLPGLPSSKFAANAQATSAGWAFTLAVPADTYDIYVTPLSGCEASFPPLLLPAQQLKADTVALNLTVGSLSELSGTISAPSRGASGQYTSLNGWTISVVEPQQGRVISTQRKLGESNPTNFAVTYQPMDGLSPLIKLSPPADLVAPTLLWDLSVVDLDGDDKVGLDISALQTSPVLVEARVVGENQQPVAGTSVRLLSTQLAGAAQGLNARYDVTVSSASDGTAHIAVPPGRYRAIASPPDLSPYGMQEASWEIGDQGSSETFTVQLAALEHLQGTVLEPLAAQPLPSVTVTAVPIVSGSTDLFAQVLGLAPVLPRTVSTVSQGDGLLELALDPGRYDIVFQPPADSLYPWRMRTRVTVPGEALGQVMAQLPVVLSGSLRDPAGNAVQQALLRAFVPLDPNSADYISPSLEGSSALGILQVAEGRSDQSGRFQLLLPPSLR